MLFSPPMIIPAFDASKLPTLVAPTMPLADSILMLRSSGYIGHCVGSQQRCHVLDIYISDRAFEISIICHLGFHWRLSSRLRLHQAPLWRRCRPLWRPRALQVTRFLAVSRAVGGRRGRCWRRRGRCWRRHGDGLRGRG